MVSGASEGDGEIVDPREERQGFKEKHKNDEYGGIAGSFRQERLQGSLPPSTSVVSQPVCVHTDTQYLHQPLAQAPISSVPL